MSKNNKNKNKQQNNNSQKIVVQEFDYDKLAEAIVKAQKKVEIVPQEDDDEETFVEKAVTEKIQQGKLFPQSLSKLMQAFFYVLAVAIALSMLLVIALIVIGIINTGWSDIEVVFTNIYLIAIAVLSVPIVSVAVVIMFKIAKELGAEKDKNYIISSFSSVVSFVALIVALIALFKGVG